MRVLNLLVLIVLTVSLIPNLNAILQFGPLPHATLMASSSGVLILVCAVLISRRRPFAKAIVVCLAAFPGIMIVLTVLYGVGALDELSETGYAALNEVARGLTGGGALGLLYVGVLAGVSAMRHKRENSN